MQLVREETERSPVQARSTKKSILGSGTPTPPSERAPQRHAILIHCDQLVADALEQRLTQLGYSSIVRTCSENQASAEARQRRPDLMMVGDTVDEQPGILAALRLRQRLGVPVVLVPPAGSSAGDRSQSDIAAAIREATGEQDASLPEHEEHARL